MKKLKVSIGIPAYNEERNIKNVLKSILDQKEKSITIKEIIVASDGSTDNTVQFAKSIDDQRLKVIKYVGRRGKPTILNRLFKIFKGDVLVIVDADSILKDELVIESLVSKLHKDKSIGVITGNPQPLPAETFLESAINNYIYARNKVFDKYDIGKSAYTARGFLVYSKKFLKNFILPDEVINDDTYSYFYCLRNSYRALNEKGAVVRYRPAQTISEHIKQSTRHLAGGVQLYRYFGQEAVDKKFSLPKMALLRIMLYQLIRNPMGYILLKALNIYCFYLSRKQVEKFDNKWESISTSKNLYTR
ncbi:MAG: glycosyltransferase [Candidatus Levybacteria bacterium]|nr:glycosyltransferase [Candidatus Levybacteria bacterium]